MKVALNERIHQTSLVPPTPDYYHVHQLYNLLRHISINGQLVISLRLNSLINAFSSSQKEKNLGSPCSLFSKLYFGAFPSLIFSLLFCHPCYSSKTLNTTSFPLKITSTKVFLFNLNIKFKHLNLNLIKRNPKTSP